MNTTTQTPVETPHALAIELLRTEAGKLQRHLVILERIWRRTITQPASKYNPDAVDEAETAVKDNRDRLARIRESISALERVQADRAAEQAARSEKLPDSAATAISSHFIARPKNVEIIGAKLLGHGQWDVETRITYAGTEHPEPRQFLLVRTNTGRLLVNP